MTRRSHGILVADARTLLLHSGLSPSFWPHAIRHATYLRNRLPSSASEGKSPFEALTGMRPGLRHLKPFGCMVIARVPPELRKDGKLNARGFEGVFLGYDSFQCNAFVYDIRRRTVEVSADTLFHEELFPARRPRTTLPSLVDLSGTDEDREAFRRRVEGELKPARMLGGQGTELPAAPSVLAPPVRLLLSRPEPIERMLALGQPRDRFDLWPGETRMKTRTRMRRSMAAALPFPRAKGSALLCPLARGSARRLVIRRPPLSPLLSRHSLHRPRQSSDGRT